MSDWRPYEPSLEAERSAVYERAACRVMTLTLAARARLERMLDRYRDNSTEREMNW